jgi:hypothetical protein
MCECIMRYYLCFLWFVWPIGFQWLVAASILLRFVAYAKHLNENGHSFGLIKNIMETLQFQRKGIYKNTVERFYIHKESITNYHLNDPKTLAPNQIFDILTNNHRPQ